MVFDKTMTTLLRTGLRIVGLELGAELSEGRRKEITETFGNGSLVLVDVDVDEDGFVVVASQSSAVQATQRAQPTAAAAANQAQQSGRNRAGSPPAQNAIKRAQGSRASSKQLAPVPATSAYPGFKALQFYKVTKV